MNLIKSIPPNRVLLEKLTIAQLLEKFPTVVTTRRFIVAFHMGPEMDITLV